jgi:hypothetical protein
MLTLFRFPGSIAEFLTKATYTHAIYSAADFLWGLEIWRIRQLKRLDARKFRVMPVYRL